VAISLSDGLPRPRMTRICHALLLYRGNARYKDDTGG
jgi:hypothetical protein